jgi:hypothetical protein
MGFVSKVVPGGLKGVEEEAVRMGGVVAGKSPVAVLGTKNILNCESETSLSTVGDVKRKLILYRMHAILVRLEGPFVSRPEAMASLSRWRAETTFSFDSVDDGLNYTAAWNM